MKRKRRAVLGWSRTKVEIAADAVVLDIGSGAWPNDAATIACDRSLDEDPHRTGLAAKVDRPFVICDATALPFRDKGIDFVIASHIAEHIEDPDGFCRELSRTAKEGYVETPSPLADYLLDEEYHRWRVGGRGSMLRFGDKPSKSRLMQWLTGHLYRIFYAGRATGAPTHRMPPGALGRICGMALYGMRGLLNRSGLMHTRVRFDATSPLTWIVAAAQRRRVTVVERGPRSGFLEGDRLVLEDRAEVRVVRYPGWPSPRFLWQLWQRIGWADVVYTFFASEQAGVASVMARLRRTRFVVSVGGYDVACVRRHGYGLRTKWPHRWLVRRVLRLSDRVVAISRAARVEAIEAGAPPELTSVVYIGLDGRFAAPPDDVRRDPDQVVTVAYVDDLSWCRKGIDRFVAAAKKDPTRPYVLVGRVSESIAERELVDPPPNLRITGFLDDEALRRLLWESGVYAQLSWHEGFGVSMVEAMQAGCVPVATTLPALREVAGPLAEYTAGAGDDVVAIGRAASRDVDREQIKAWAQSISSMDDRARGLEAALFPAV